jgi:hypothetical protein
MTEREAWTDIKREEWDNREPKHGRCKSRKPNKNVNVKFEVLTEVTMKNGVFLDIKTQFVPHRRHITSPLQSSAS